VHLQQEAVRLLHSTCLEFGIPSCLIFKMDLYTELSGDLNLQRFYGLDAASEESDRSDKDPAAVPGSTGSNKLE
jgi:hypothetical protein